MEVTMTGVPEGWSPDWADEFHNWSTDLKEFEWQPGELYDEVEQQSQQIVPQIGRLLGEYIRRDEGRGKETYSTVSIKVMNFGTSSIDARPYIVVLVPDRDYVRTAQYFTKPSAQKLYKPLFKVQIYPLPSGLFIPTHPYLTTEAILPQYCGLPVVRRTEDQDYRMATCGGLIRVTDHSGNSVLYGLTVDHFIGDHREAGIAAEPDSPRMIPDPDPEDPDWDEFEEDPTVPVIYEHDPFLDSVSRTAPDLDEELYIGPRNLVQLGGISIRNSYGMQENNVIMKDYNRGRSRYYDWALIQVNGYILSRAFSSSDWRLRTSQHPLIPHEGTTSLPVYIMTCRGHKSGTMSLLPSQLQMRPGRIPIKTFIVSTTGGKRKSKYFPFLPLIWFLQ